MLAIQFSRGNDEKAIEVFRSESLPAMEKLCKEANGGWLSQAETPSYLDAHCGPWFEVMYLWKDSAANTVFNRLDLHRTAPNLLAYAERLR